MYNYSSVNLSCLIFKFNCHASIQVYNLENTTIAMTLQIHLRIFMTKHITVVNTGLWRRSTTLDRVLNIYTIRNFTHLWLSLTTKATLVSKHSLLDLGKKTKVIQIKDQISEIWVHSYCSIMLDFLDRARWKIYVVSSSKMKVFQIIAQPQINDVWVFFTCSHSRWRCYLEQAFLFNNKACPNENTWADRQRKTGVKTTIIRLHRHFCDHWKCCCEDNEALKP